ncbi:MAG: peptidoglycan -binding protein [Amaricoccus sp.]
MALSRRGSGRFSAQIWPGFVDAMTAMILVLFFVLSIFMIVQFVLRDTITGQGEELDRLSVQVANLADALGLERTRADTQQALVTTLTGQRDQLASANSALSSEKDQLASEMQSAEARVADFEAQVASLIARNTDISGKLTAAEKERAEIAGKLTATEKESAERLTAQQALEASLAQARAELDKGAEEARLAAAKREAMEALVASLQSDVAGLKGAAAGQEASLANARKLTADQAAQLAAAAILASEQAKKLDAATKLTAEQRAALDAANKRAAEGQAQLDAATRLTAEQRAELDAAMKKADEQAAKFTEADANRLLEAAAAEALRQKLASSQAELTAMTLSLEAERKKAEDTLTLLAAADAAKKGLETDKATALSDAEKRAAELAQANALLAEQKNLSAEGQRQVALLNQQTASLREQLNSLQGTLDASAAKDAAAQVQIENLGANLNSALAQVAVEQKRRADLEEKEKERLQAEAHNLESYRSEFFGQMRAILGDREGVQVVGDRFVFPSEVLFAPGSATLGPEGQQQVARVAQVIREIADQIPPEINWILRVDGHTDKTPVTPGGPFRDNWELSEARALSVVRYMSQVQGLPPERLAATGFGEFQPIDPGDSPEALAKNRRIELKFTER